MALCIDSFSITFAYIGAYRLRLGAFSPQDYMPAWGYVFASILPITLFIFWLCKIYNISIRYASFQLLKIIFIASLSSAFLLYFLSSAFSMFLPRSIPLIYMLLLLLFCAASRILVHNFYYYAVTSSRLAPAVIYGAGESGRQLASALQAGSQFFLVAFIDDSKLLQKRSIHGLTVYAPSSLPYLQERYGVQKVLLAMPSATRSCRKNILDALMPLNLEVLSLPSISELAMGVTEKTPLQKIAIEDLLGRDPIPPVASLLSRNIAGQNVLVTGAGGSIGSELCRQIVAGGARSLVLFELSEVALYTIAKELKEHNPLTSTRIIPLLGNVQDKAKLIEIFTAFDVQTVYHAAAYKHVPIVEYNNIAAVYNNVFGTLACIEAAIVSRVQHFVAISTDKAVRPTNLMGATKRVAEMILQTHAHVRDNLSVCMVRFGNVLGSSGSVVPLFKRQIAAGGPVTVTHPDIVRYFMTIPEAVQLVIQAGSMGNKGEVFVLDMGKPMKILELAQKMILLSGLRICDEKTPDGDIAIQFSGLRPGEKLYEELLIEGDFSATEHPRIMQKQEDSLAFDALGAFLEKIQAACAAGDVELLHSLFQIPEIAFTPELAVKDLLWQESHDAIAAQSVTQTEAITL